MDPHMTEVALAIDADNYLGETPVWSAARQVLWWINCEQPPELHMWSAAEGTHQSWPMPQRIGGIVEKADGGLLVALADGIYNFEPETGALSLRVSSPLPAQVKLHECQCDRQGRFWIGAYDHDFPANREARGGSIFRLDGNELTPVIEGISVANALAFSPDGRTMYVSDSPTRRVNAYDLDPVSGSISNQRTFILLHDGEGFVDGATVDSKGGYWLANVGAGALRRYWPDGSLDRIVSLPFSNPTKPTFGGADLSTLYVTSTRLALQSSVKPVFDNGGIFALRPGERGLPETPFAE
jgi:L-arabinonolactonase